MFQAPPPAPSCNPSEQLIQQEQHQQLPWLSWQLASQWPPWTWPNCTSGSLFCLFARFDKMSFFQEGWTMNSSSSSETYLWPTDSIPEKYPPASSADTHQYSRDDDNELHQTSSSEPWHRRAHHDNRQHQQRSHGSEHHGKHHQQRSQQHRSRQHKKHRDQDNWIESSGKVWRLEKISKEKLKVKET